MYLSCVDENKPEYNDVLIPYDDHSYKTLKEHGELVIAIIRVAHTLM